MKKKTGRKDGAVPLRIQDIEMELVRKPTLRNLRIRIYASDGRVRVSAPDYLGDDVVRRFVTDRLSWIRQKRELIANRLPQGERELVTGGTERYEGRDYRLQVIEGPGRESVEVTQDGVMILRVKPLSSQDSRERLLSGWYRGRLKEKIPPLIAKWERVIGVVANEWGVKTMRTRWGSCNTGEKRIWLNLDLARKRPDQLEYVVVHELVHLLERSHNQRFKTLMDGFLPEWREIRKALNYGSPSHEE
jgi:predicted metal-dependent hydrolase